MQICVKLAPSLPCFFFILIRMNRKLKCMYDYMYPSHFVSSPGHLGKINS